jgi:small subunit ribosomal protein S6
MFILDSNHYAKDGEGVSGAVVNIIEKAGGEILASRLWSEQKLAYEINGHRKGTYWLTYFRIDTQRLKDINRAVRLNDTILRSLVIKIEPRLVEPMVDHALGKTQEEPAAEEGKAEEKSGAAKTEAAAT